MICDKTKEWCVQIFIPYKRPLSLVFWEEEWLVRATLSTWNFGSAGPRWSKITDFRSIFARSSSEVAPSKRVQITLSGSQQHAFQWVKGEHRTLPLSPKGQRGLKTQNGRFLCKIALCLKKVCYKVSSCENCQRQSCKAFIGLTISAKMIGGDVPFCVKILADTDPPPCKMPIFCLFSPIAPQP